MTVHTADDPSYTATGLSANYRGTLAHNDVILLAEIPAGSVIWGTFMALDHAGPIEFHDDTPADLTISLIDVEFTAASDGDTALFDPFDDVSLNVNADGTAGPDSTSAWFNTIPRRVGRPTNLWARVQITKRSDSTPLTTTTVQATLVAHLQVTR